MRPQNSRKVRGWVITPKDMSVAGLPDAHEYLDSLSPDDLQKLIDGKLKRQAQKLEERAAQRRLKANRPTPSAKNKNKTKQKKEAQMARAFLSARDRQLSLAKKRENVLSEASKLRGQLERGDELKETKRKRRLNPTNTIEKEKRIAQAQKQFRQRVEEMSANRAGGPMTEQQKNEEVAILMRNSINRGYAPIYTTKLSKQKRNKINAKIDELERQALRFKAREEQLTGTMRKLANQMESETYSQQVLPKLKT